MFDDFKYAIRRNGGLFILVMVVVVISKLVNIMPALITGRVVDKFADGAVDSDTISYLLGFVMVGVISVVLVPVQGYYLTRFIQVGLREASIRWVGEIFDKNFEMFSSVNVGKILKAVERGIHAGERILNYALITVLPLIIEFLVVSVWLVCISNLVLLTIILALSAAYLVMTHYLIKWRRSHIDDVNDAEDEQAGVFANTIQAGKQIRLERAQVTGLVPLFETFRQYADAATQVGYSAAVLSASRALFLTLTSSMVIAYGIFVRQTSAPQLTVGDFVVLFTLSTMFFNNVFNIGEVYRFADQFSSDHAKFRRLLQQPTLKKGTAVSSFTSHSLVYPASTVMIAEGVSLAVHYDIEVPAGQHVALVGASGSGKTTFVELLAGIRQVPDLLIRLGETPLDSLSEDDHFRVIRYCPQTPRFLSGNLVNAVFFHGAPHSDLNSLASALNVQHLFEEDPCRFINEDATSISGGEAKKLSLLRVMLRPGCFNIFDEPTSSVDPQGASLIWRTLFGRFAGTSLICVTHDFVALDHFDRVIVLDHGRVIADGKWADLAQLDSVSGVIRKVKEEESMSSLQS